MKILLYILASVGAVTILGTLLALFIVSKWNREDRKEDEDTIA